jgi:hypothetical protein
MAETEIVPLNEVAQLANDTGLPEKVSVALASLEALTSQVSALKGRADAIEVKDAASYLQIGAVLTEERGLLKQGTGLVSPFEAIVERVKNFFRTKRQAHELACRQIDDICTGKMKAYERPEAEAAAAEEKKLNKRKAPEAQVTVKPNVPAVSSYRRSTVYRIEVVNIALFLRAAKERKELRQFIILDEQALAAEARQMKDIEGFNKRFPGCRCHKE